MLVAGLLLALAPQGQVAACPEILTDGGMLKSVFAALNMPGVIAKRCYHEGEICLPATQEYPCCIAYFENEDLHGVGFSDCFTRSDFNAAANSGVVVETTGLQCKSTISSVIIEEFSRYDAIDCFPPAPPATDEGINEAETGVIVVVSLIAFAAVAGAVAVYRAGM